MDFERHMRDANYRHLHSLVVLRKELSVTMSDSTEGLLVLNALEDMPQEHSKVEQLLDEYSYLVGPTPTAVDAIVFPEIALIERAITTNSNEFTELDLADWRNQYPKISEWERGVRAIPAVANTFPPHWVN